MSVIRMPRWPHLVTGAAVLLVTFLVLFSMLPTYAIPGPSDDQFLRVASTAYTKHEYLQAALDYYAYRELSPQALQNNQQWREKRTRQDLGSLGQGATGLPCLLPAVTE
jgi:glucan phosphoethanolaminetransferase (alkaline phosphatase superfamily)